MRCDSENCCRWIDCSWLSIRCPPKKGRLHYSNSIGSLVTRVQCFTQIPNHVAMPSPSNQTRPPNSPPKTSCIHLQPTLDRPTQPRALLAFAMASVQNSRPRTLFVRSAPANASVRPVPNRLQKRMHIHPLGLHIHHPRVLEHAPGCCAAVTFFLQTTRTHTSQHHHPDNEVLHPRHSCDCTYLHSMKYLKFALHFNLLSGSSFSFGIGCRTIYVSKSIRPALGFISVPSAGKGKRCCATSSKVTPNDQTSEVMVYDCPVIRSGAM